ncbi:MAG: FtsQ-type POTRA domain-containing protein [Gemmatimonadaceae bacterium]|nr:FtsQ-type POTRA domain-containing protein [Gemmatimonadaceae bacterium]
MTADAPESKRRRLPWRLIAGVPIVLMLVASPWWAPRAAAKLAFFRVRRVEIVGTQYIPAGDILRRLNVDTTHSVWDPPAPLEARLAHHPEVRSVRIRRRLPGTLVVEIVESLPVALVPTPGGLRAYDERGMLLPVDPARVDIDAPVLARRDTALLRLLGELRRDAPSVYARVSEVRRVARGDVWMRVASLPVLAANDVTIDRLLELDPVAQDLARRQLRPAELDLRFRDQVIARLQ